MDLHLIYMHINIYIYNTIICICLCNCVYVCVCKYGCACVYLHSLLSIPKLRITRLNTKLTEMYSIHNEGWLFSFVWGELICHRNCWGSFRSDGKKTDPIADMRSRFWGILKTSTFDWRLAVALSAQILAGIDQLWVTYGNLQKMKASPVHAAKHRQQRDVSLFGPIPS